MWHGHATERQFILSCLQGTEEWSRRKVYVIKQSWSQVSSVDHHLSLSLRRGSREVTTVITGQHNKSLLPGWQSVLWISAVS
jgi:hypothetical protein